MPEDSNEGCTVNRELGNGRLGNSTNTVNTLN